MNTCAQTLVSIWPTSLLTSFQRPSYQLQLGILYLSPFTLSEVGAKSTEPSNYIRDIAATAGLPKIDNDGEVRVCGFEGIFSLTCDILCIPCSTHLTGTMPLYETVIWESAHCATFLFYPLSVVHNFLFSSSQTCST